MSRRQLGDREISSNYTYVCVIMPKAHITQWPGPVSFGVDKLKLKLRVNLIYI